MFATSCFMGNWVSPCPLLSVWLSQRVPHPLHIWAQYLPERGRVFMAQVLQQITREHSPSLIHSWFWAEEKLKSNFTLNLIKLSQRQSDARFGKGNSHQLRQGGMDFFSLHLFHFQWTLKYLLMKRPELECTASHSCLCYQTMALCLFNVCLSSHLHLWNSEATTKQIKWWPLLPVSYPPGLWQESGSNPYSGFKARSGFEFSFNHLNWSQKEYCEEH